MDTLAATVATTDTPVDTVTTDIPHHEESHPPKLDATDVTRTVFSPPTNMEVVDPSKKNDPTPITTRTMTDRRSNHHHHPNPRGGGNASSSVSSMSSSRKRLTTTELVQLDQKKNKNRNDTDKNDDDDTSNIQKERTTPDHFHTNDLYAMRSRTINRGSYAHEPQRQLFQVTFEDDPPSSHLPPPARTKRKVTMLMGYLGTNYGGFQINEGVRSIQSELELALYRNQYISRDNFGCPQKYHWSTSGRTDKGVHAAAQVVSMKMELLPHELQTTCHGDDDDDDNDVIATGSCSSSGSRNEMLHRINASLPNDIRIFDICRTNKNFTAKIQRDYVQYRYLIPSIYFYPRDQLNTIMTKTIVSCTPLNTTTTTVLERQPQVEDHHDQHYSTTNKNINAMTTEHTANSNEDSVVPPSNSTPQTPPPPQWHITPEEVRQIYDVIADYRSTLEQRQVLQSTVKQYVGTHSFHNFTKRCTSKEARSARYIMDFIVEEPMIMETTIPGTHQTYQMEWIPVNVIGQSFLLNQIRKMVWFAIEIARGAIPATALNVALQRNPSPTATSSVPVHIGMAPAQGLFLDMSYYKNYNEKILRAKNSPQTNNDAVGELNWHLEHTVAHRRWKEFRNNVITQHIAQEEVQHGNFLQQIYMEEHRSYFYQHGTTKDEEEEEEEEGNDDE